MLVGLISGELRQGAQAGLLVDALCRRMRADFQLAVITNDIFTREDMEFLVRSEALTPDRRRKRAA